MLISLRADGTAVMLLPSHVYQGSNVANVFVTAPFPNTTVLQVGFTLPNGTTASAPMTYVQDSENNLVVWQYTIAEAITNEAGAASVSITATTTTGQVIASQSIPFTIEETTLPVLPDVPSQDEYTLILQYIQQNSAKIATLQGQVSVVEEDVANANDKASEALSTAQSAEQTAQQAETTANGLAASIEKANTNANNALNTANRALNTANEAQTTAQQIQDTAQSAVDIAQDAKSAAESAQNSAETTLSVARDALRATEILKTSKQDVTDNNLTTTSKTVVGAINENVTAIAGLREDFINEAHFKGYFSTDAEVEAAPANLNDFAYSAESGTVWIYGASGWADSGKPVPDQTTPLADTVPLMDGTGSAGTATSASRADHVHPTDTSRASQSDLQTEIDNRQEADTTLQNNIDAKYTKPTSGIPETDLSLDVQQKLNSGGGGGGGASLEWLSSTEYDSVWDDIVFDKAFNNADVLDVSVMLQGTLTYNEQTYMAIVFVEGGVSVNDASNIAQTWTQGYALPAGGDMSSTFPIAGMFFLKHSDGSKKVGWQFTIQFVNNSAVPSPAATDFKVDAIGRANILIK